MLTILPISVIKPVKELNFFCTSVIDSSTTDLVFKPMVSFKLSFLFANSDSNSKELKFSAISLKTLIPSIN